jgi:hypothetical protein
VSASYLLPAYHTHSPAMSNEEEVTNTPEELLRVPNTPEELLPGGPAAPRTPEDLLAGAAEPGHESPDMVVPEDRRAAGGRDIIWPAQGGVPAPLQPSHLLGGLKKEVVAMQELHQEVYALMMFTETHLEAALGRNRGNRLCRSPGNFPTVIPAMKDTLEVPYSLHELGLRFDCLLAKCEPHVLTILSIMSICSRSARTSSSG